MDSEGTNGGVGASLRRGLPVPPVPPGPCVATDADAGFGWERCRLKPDSDSGKLGQNEGAQPSHPEPADVDRAVSEPSLALSFPGNPRKTQSPRGFSFLLHLLKTPEGVRPQDLFQSQQGTQLAVGAEAERKLATCSHAVSSCTTADSGCLLLRDLRVQATVTSQLRHPSFHVTVPRSAIASSVPGAHPSGAESDSVSRT